MTRNVVKKSKSNLALKQKGKNFKKYVGTYFANEMFDLTHIVKVIDGKRTTILTI